MLELVCAVEEGKALKSNYTLSGCANRLGDSFFPFVFQPDIFHFVVFFSPRQKDRLLSGVERDQISPCRQGCAQMPSNLTVQKRSHCKGYLIIKRLAITCMASLMGMPCYFSICTCACSFSCNITCVFVYNALAVHVWFFDKIFMHM